MGQVNLLKDLASEESLQEFLSGVIMLINAIHEKMPRVDGNDRVVINASEVNPTVAIAASQTLASVSSVSSITTIAGATAPGANISMALAAHGSINAGLTLVYNNIQVS